MYSGKGSQKAGQYSPAQRAYAAISTAAFAAGLRVANWLLTASRYNIYGLPHGSVLMSKLDAARPMENCTGATMKSPALQAASRIVLRKL